jgi:citrate synthase
MSVDEMRLKDGNHRKNLLEGDSMDRQPLIKRKTALSYKTEEKTVVRGYNVSDLAEAGYTFYDMLFILFQNRIAAENEVDMLRYETGEFLEHSMSPSAASAIAVIGGRPNLPAAIAAAVMTFGSAHGPGGGARLHDAQVHRARPRGGEDPRRDGQDPGR